VLLVMTSESAAQGHGPAWNFGGGYHHASTVEEGAARGMADVVRSAGYANLMNSEAAINLGQATSQYIDNRMQATQTYFQMRSINKQAREAERGPLPTQEAVIRYSKSRVPQRLSKSDLDPISGQLSWPSILVSEDYKDGRDKLEALYMERAKKGYLSLEEFTQVQNLAKQMDNQLKENISKYPPGAYVNAKKFVRSLALESNLQAG